MPNSLPHLLPDECRVLGTLIEKAQTTPNQYPLTLNALVNGVNQKSNRWPLVTIGEDRALHAIDGLRSKGLIREVSMAGARVEKFRHIAREALQIGTNEVVILAELLLRGPKTVGEIRGRASRMHPFDTIEGTQTILDGMANGEQPLVREVPPVAGSRAKRWAQLLCPDLHPLDAAGPEDADDAASDNRHVGASGREDRLRTI
ncbi:MAG: DUF480 domain-containing protein, partial [Phycisphaerae bacterium]|nr:DUF480 domain-containing protein [Phycisphaerae bacterium]